MCTENALAVGKEFERKIVPLYKIVNYVVNKAVYNPRGFNSIVRMENGPVQQVDMGITDTHIAGQYFVKNGFLAISGGYDRSEAWTPNYDPNTCDPETLNRRVVRMIHNSPRLEVTSFTADETRVIGGSTVCDPSSGLVFSFGGIKQVVTAESRLLQKRYCGKLSAYDMGQSNDNVILFDAMKESSGMFPLQDSCVAYRPDRNETPCARMFHASAWDPINNFLWIFGGVAPDRTRNSEIVYLSDLWVWSLSTGLWKKLSLGNPPPPKMGATMGYMDGKMYLFGGAPLAQREYLWFVDVRITDESTWEKVPVPSHVGNRGNGCVIVPYIDALNRRYVFFSGGMRSELYGKICRSAIETKICATLKDCSIWKYSVEKNLCDECLFSDTVGEVAYHSAACVQDHLVFAGGVNFLEKQSGVELSVNTTAARVPMNTLLGKKKVGVSKKLDSLKQDRMLDNTITRTVKGATCRCITKTLAYPRSRKLHALFQSHQSRHNAKHFVLIGDTYIEKRILEKRFGLSNFPFYIRDRALIRDIGMYAYSDCIDPCVERHFDFFDFLTVMEYCRVNSLYRFMSLELGLVIGNLSASNFFTLALSCRGFPGVPMFADPNLPLLKTAFEKLVPQYHSFADFSVIDGCSARLSRYILSHLHASPTDLEFTSVDHLEAMIPSSDYETALTEYFAEDDAIETSNGPLFVDEEFLSFDPLVLVQTDLYVVKALYECNIASIFAFNSVDFIVSALQLINASTRPLDDALITRLLGNCESTFIEFAKLNDGISEKLLSLLPNIRFRKLAELVIDMLGSKGEVVIRGANGCSVMYDATLGTSLPSGEITTHVSKNALMALTVLMYVQCSIESLYQCFAREELADQFLTLCETSSFLPPQNLRKVIIEFVIGEMFNKKTITPDFVARHFPRLFRADIHARVVSLCDVAAVARCAEAYIDTYDVQQIKWLLTQVSPPKPNILK